MNSRLHSICDECWKREKPGREPAIAQKTLDVTACCWCLAEHHSGIFVWHFRIKDLKCQGKHHAQSGGAAA